MPRYQLPTLALAAFAACAVPQAGAAQEEDEARRALSVFEACARIAQESERHRCLDDALKTTGMIDPKQVEERRRAEFGMTEAQREKVAEQATGPLVAPAVAATATVEQTHASAAKDVSEPDSLVTTVHSARVIGGHTMQVTTPDAGSWISTQRDEFRRRPGAGDRFEILPAAFGGFRCRLERSTIYPCRRLD